MVDTVTLAVFTALGLVVFTYLYLLNKRLKTPHPDARPLPMPSLEELEKTEYGSIDMLKAVPKATDVNYVVLGGSGTTGSTLARLLLMRNDTNVRVVDIFPPPADIALDVEYVRADIGNAAQIYEALSKPFRDGRPVDVVHNTSALIRFWDRVSYSYHMTSYVNVDGPRNVVDALRKINSNEVKGKRKSAGGEGAAQLRPSEKLFVHTSSSAILVDHPYFMRLGFGRRSPRYSDDSEPHPPHTLASHNYADTKRRGDAIVRAAHGKDGVKTSVLRAGMSVQFPEASLFIFLSPTSYACPQLFFLQTGGSLDRGT
jgi:hypothetical protein